MDPKLTELIIQEDQDAFAQELADLLRENAAHVTSLVRIAADDPEIAERIRNSCTIYFGCLAGMHDAGIVPFLQLAELTAARDCFDQLYGWFTGDRIEGSDRWPVEEDREGDRLALCKHALHTIALLQPDGAHWMSNYWLQIWYGEEYAPYYYEAYLGFIMSDPVSAGLELPRLMELGLPETEELLKHFHARLDARPILLDAIKRGCARGDSWAAGAKLLLGLNE